jgi:parallel beta-helix repeat protein
MNKTFYKRYFFFSAFGVVLFIFAIFGQKYLVTKLIEPYITPKIEITKYLPQGTEINVESNKDISITETPSIILKSRDIFYVSSNGNNYDDGSFEHPWKTIQFAVDRIKPGGVIFVRQGQFFENIHINRSGEQGKPILLSSYNKDDVTIDGGLYPAITGNADFWIVKGFTLKSKADRVLRLNTNNWKILTNTIFGAVYLWGDHNILEKNDIDGSRHLGNENGFMEDGPSSFANIIKNNEIHDFYQRGIWSQWFTHESEFEQNTVYNITGKTGICIDMDGATSIVYLHIIRGNTVYNCGQTGIELENSYNSLVENNLVYDTGLEGIQIISYNGCKQGGINNQFGNISGDCRGDKVNSRILQNIIFNGGRVGGIVSYESSGLKIYHNTIYGGESVAIYINSSSEFSKDLDLRGNILSSHERAEISLVDPESLSFDDHNLIFNKISDHAYEVRGSVLNFYSLSQWQEKFSLGVNSITDNPWFIDPFRNDFHLSNDSSAIDAGLDLGITTDFDGISRPQINGTDIGAYEFIKAK